jgi:hypothetical protein
MTHIHVVMLTWHCPLSRPRALQCSFTITVGCKCSCCAVARQSLECMFAGVCVCAHASAACCWAMQRVCMLSSALLNPAGPLGTLGPKQERLWPPAPPQSPRPLSPTSPTAAPTSRSTPPPTLLVWRWRPLRSPRPSMPAAFARSSATTRRVASSLLASTLSHATQLVRAPVAVPCRSQGSRPGCEPPEAGAAAWAKSCNPVPRAAATARVSTHMVHA